MGKMKKIEYYQNEANKCYKNRQSPSSYYAKQDNTKKAMSESTKKIIYRLPHIGNKRQHQDMK